MQSVSVESTLSKSVVVELLMLLMMIEEVVLYNATTQ